MMAVPRSLIWVTSKSILRPANVHRASQSFLRSKACFARADILAKDVIFRQFSIKPKITSQQKHTLPLSQQSKSLSSYRKQVVERYLRLLETHPYQTKMVTSGLIAGAGDVLSQMLVSGDPFDPGRLLRYAGVGALVTAPVIHNWYNFLARRLPRTDLPSVLRRLALDQFVATPFLIVGFFGLFMALDGQGPDAIRGKVAQDFWPTLRSNWMVWIPANLVNFRCVPVNLQVLYSNCVGLFWNIYLSSAASRAVEVAEEQSVEKQPQENENEKLE